MPLYVQYGCGLSHPTGWLNFDVSPRLRVERLPVVGKAMRRSGKALYPADVRYGDIVSGLPVADRSVTGLYCSHVLEHIDRQSVTAALRNSYRLLAPGGIFRLVVPDLAWRARKLIADIDAGSDHASDDFMRTSYLGEAEPARGAMARLHNLIGNSQHRWMYDKAQLSRLLTAAGFEGIRECNIGDCEDENFNKVEEHGRFYDEGQKELALEARRA